MWVSALESASEWESGSAYHPQYSWIHQPPCSSNRRTRFRRPSRRCCCQGNIRSTPHQRPARSRSPSGARADRASASWERERHSSSSHLREFDSSRPVSTHARRSGILAVAWGQWTASFRPLDASCVREISICRRRRAPADGAAPRFRGDQRAAMIRQGSQPFAVSAGTPIITLRFDAFGRSRWKLSLYGRFLRPAPALQPLLPWGAAVVENLARYCLDAALATVVAAVVAAVVVAVAVVVPHSRPLRHGRNIGHAANVRQPCKAPAATSGPAPAMCGEIAISSACSRC